MSQWQKNLDITLNNILNFKVGLPPPPTNDREGPVFLPWPKSPVADSIFDQLLNHLKFSKISVREERVAKAHSQTFEWIFSMPTQKVITWHSFTNWLENNDHVYWITGKAGSGKSTLMKFILNDHRTQEHLKVWAEDSHLIVSSYYFWLGGTEQLQHSQEGLLRTLLYQSLKQLIEVAPETASVLWNTLALFKDLETQWTWTDLEQAFRFLLDDNSTKIKYCFIIDGLDELKGDPQSLLSFIRKICHYPNVKVCVSSRPLFVFGDQFGTTAHLQLEDLTRDDIKLYASSKLGANVAFKEFQMSNDGEKLIEEIVGKAQGVFLWVILVVLSLEEGLRDGDRLSDLRRKLDALPPELDDLFRKILHNFDRRFVGQASALFQMVKAAPTSLSLLTLSLADEEDTNLAVKARVEPTLAFPHQRFYRALNMRRRLDSRCKGLLEAAPIWIKRSLSSENATSAEDGIPPIEPIQQGATLPTIVVTAAADDHTVTDAAILRDLGILPPERGDLLAYAEVEYLHRTVKDFLDQPDIWTELVSATDADFHPCLALARSYLLQLKWVHHRTLKINEGGYSSEPWNSLFWLIEYYAIAESSGFVDVKLLDELEKWIRPYFHAPAEPQSPATRDSDYGMGYWPIGREDGPPDFLHLAVRCGLKLYLDKKLSSTKPDDRYIESLLDTATSEYKIQYSRPTGPAFQRLNVNLGLVKMLLDHSDLSQKERTLWLRKAEECRVLEDSRNRSSSDSSRSLSGDMMTGNNKATTKVARGTSGSRSADHSETEQSRMSSEEKNSSRSVKKGESAKKSLAKRLRHHWSGRAKSDP